MRNTYENLPGRPEAKKPLGISSSRCTVLAMQLLRDRKIIPCGGGVEYLHRALRVVGVDEKGGLESETGIYGAGERQQQL
jgi:hypothetical protein